MLIPSSIMKEVLLLVTVVWFLLHHREKLQTLNKITWRQWRLIKSSTTLEGVGGVMGNIHLEEGSGTVKILFLQLFLIRGQAPINAMWDAITQIQICSVTGLKRQGIAFEGPTTSRNLVRMTRRKQRGKPPYSGNKLCPGLCLTPWIGQTPGSPANTERSHIEIPATTITEEIRVWNLNLAKLTVF